MCGKNKNACACTDIKNFPFLGELVDSVHCTFTGFITYYIFIVLLWHTDYHCIWAVFCEQQRNKQKMKNKTSYKYAYANLLQTQMIVQYII